MKTLIKLSENVDKLAIPAAALFGFALVFAYMTGGFTPAPPDDRWFQSKVIDQPMPVVVKFGADWCGPCRSMDKVLTRYSGQSGGSVRVVRVNIDERPDLASHYNVRGIPKTILFKHGKPVSSITGSRDFKSFSQWVDGYR